MKNSLLNHAWSQSQGRLSLWILLILTAASYFWYDHHQPSSSSPHSPIPYGKTQADQVTYTETTPQGQPLLSMTSPQLIYHHNSSLQALHPILTWHDHSTYSTWLIHADQSYLIDDKIQLSGNVVALKLSPTHTPLRLTTNQLTLDRHSGIMETHQPVTIIQDHRRPTSGDVEQR